MKPMKTMRSAVLLGSAISVIAAGYASAGDSYPPPQPTMSEPASMWNWFIGASGGIQGDDNEEFWSGHVGMEWKNGCSSHGIFLEVAFTDFSNDTTYEGAPITRPDIGVLLPGDAAVVSVDVMPVTLNYKYEYSFSDHFGWYIGAGLGAAFVESDLNYLSSGGPKIADGDDEVFYAQIFTGIVWNVTDNFEIFSGARYYYMDEVDLAEDGFDTGGEQDDWIVEAGLRFNF